jgi:hypothetical protein
MSKAFFISLIAALLFTANTGSSADPPASSPTSTPSILVLYDGPDKEGNPGRLDALYLANLLGHFTTRWKSTSPVNGKSTMPYFPLFTSGNIAFPGHLSGTLRWIRGPSAGWVIRLDSWIRKESCGGMESRPSVFPTRSS